MKTSSWTGRFQGFSVCL